MKTKLSTVNSSDVEATKAVVDKYEQYEIIESDKEEITYYKKVINKAKEVSQRKNPLKGWNYYSQLYAKIDFDKFLNDPYFGSVRIVNETRNYVGKQAFFDLNSAILIHDWRSNFGNLFYEGVFETSIEKRQVTLDSIRDYVVEYRYIERIEYDYLKLYNLNKENSNSFLLNDIIQSIDRMQNDIIRKSLKQAKVVFGGPGTGKSTLGLHILSFLTYSFTKTKRKYPKIGIIVSNENFKYYIIKALETMDLYGKEYHQTSIILIEDYITETYNFDYVYVDEFQDLTEKASSYIFNQVSSNENQLIITIDENQNLKTNTLASPLEKLNDRNIDFDVFKLKNNYRNPQNILRAAQLFVDSDDIALKNRDENFYYSYLDFLPATKVVDFINKADGTLAIIYNDLKSRSFISDFLKTHSLRYIEFQDIDFEKSTEPILLSVEQSKGFEFDYVLFLNRKRVKNDAMFKKRVYVALTRVEKECYIISEDYIDLEYTQLIIDERYLFKQLYDQFMKGKYFPKILTQVMIDYNFDDKSFKDSDFLEHLESYREFIVYLIELISPSQLIDLIKSLNKRMVELEITNRIPINHQIINEAINKDRLSRYYLIDQFYLNSPTWLAEIIEADISLWIEDLVEFKRVDILEFYSLGSILENLKLVNYNKSLSWMREFPAFQERILELNDLVFLEYLSSKNAIDLAFIANVKTSLNAVFQKWLVMNLDKIKLKLMAVEYKNLLRKFNHKETIDLLFSKTLKDIDKTYLNDRDLMISLLIQNPNKDFIQFYLNSQFVDFDYLIQNYQDYEPDTFVIAFLEMNLKRLVDKLNVKSITNLFSMINPLIVLNILYKTNKNLTEWTPQINENLLQISNRKLLHSLFQKDAIDIPNLLENMNIETSKTLAKLIWKKPEIIAISLYKRAAKSLKTYINAKNYAYLKNVHLKQLKFIAWNKISKKLIIKD